ncbi:RloB family protein [Streptomyces gamaensis]|uniref:RloB family protein n=1 Tax=Streptomyces gamaensis TaxID=1763542 RepID=A0ABW0YUU6_9ACTN
MARDKGRDKQGRQKGPKRDRRRLPRKVHIFTEGEVTEVEYIEHILRHGEPERADRRVEHRIENDTSESKYRKPLRMVKEAVDLLREVERRAAADGLDKEKDWNWPQVWVLFDRDDHPGILEARTMAQRAGVGIAYSHPCFELWRLLHYQNYTSTFGGACGSANDRLRQLPEFVKTYGKGVKRVSEPLSKQVKPDQVLGNGRYAAAKAHAKKINSEHGHGSHPNGWDPYTDVWEFVEKGLLLRGY